MVFTSLNYLFFFIVMCIVYFLLKNKKLKICWLLLGSYYFYMCWNAKYAILMFISTVVTYLSGILISGSKENKTKKLWVALSIIINLLILAIFKYYTFIVANINAVFSAINFISLPTSLNLLLPVGISFYTFQALSYTIDVYRNDVKDEKNFLKYALFVSFFPQLVAGPIEKSKDLLKQFDEEHKLDWKRVKDGLLLIGIGVFYKLVIADRAAIIVNNVFNNLDKYTQGGGFYLIVAIILFGFQIYFDFNAYSTIARGSAKVFGYELTINFKMPYIAQSVKDFWRRWHISLSSWFKEYLYFPLGGNKKGFLRTQINILIVFLISGLWHGAAWTFVIWGLLHAIYQIAENIIHKYVLKEKEITNKFLIAVKIMVTFILVNFAWIFFRADSLGDAIIIIQNLFNFGMPISTKLLGMEIQNIIVLVISLVITFILELISLRKNLNEWLDRRNFIVRLLFYYILVFSSLIFGIYGPGYSAQEFIYFQF